MENGDYIICPICKKNYKILTGQHLKNHGINSRDEFYQKYPDSKVVSNSVSKKLANIGDTNGMKNPIARKKLSESKTQMYKDKPEVKDKITKGLRKAFANPELRKKMSDKGHWILPEQRSEKDQYHKEVTRITEWNFNKYKKILDPNNLRSRDYHLDHKYSIHNGFINNINPEILGHVCNLEILPAKINTGKCNKNSISYENLLKEIKSFNNEIYT